MSESSVSHKPLNKDLSSFSKMESYYLNNPTSDDPDRSEE